MTGPADDGYEKDNEWVDNGRLGLGGINTLFESEKKQVTENPEQTSSTALDEKSEFELFKIWTMLKAKGVESEEYREFLQWLNYQEFKAKQ